MRHYREPVYLMLLRMTRCPADADDLTLETFGKAFRQLATYQPQSSFATWLFTIASNSCIDFIRRRRLETVSLSSVEETHTGEVCEYPIPSGDANPEESMIDGQRVRQVRAVVNQLKPRYRRIIEMRYYEEMTYEEMAEQLHLPLGTVKTHLRRARAFLAEIAQQQNLSL